jgi:hypothetical protein
MVFLDMPTIRFLEGSLGGRSFERNSVVPPWVFIADIIKQVEWGDRSKPCLSMKVSHVQTLNRFPVGLLAW